MIALETFDIIVKNHTGYLEAIENAAKKMERIFGTDNYTMYYKKYNIFNITSSNLLMYELYAQLCKMIKKHLGEKPMWIQCWLNYQYQKDVLQWHNHDWEYHGYISIQPFNTKTVFENWEIENKIGQVYLGHGRASHKVEVVEPFDGKRITIGFDITDIPNKQYGVLGLMPII